MAVASEGIKAVPSKIVDFFKKMEKGKLVKLIVLTVLIIAIVASITVFLNRKTYTVLYSGMNPSDTGEVLAMLREMGVEAQSRGQDTVLVADDKVDDIRLELAGKGYPSSGMNYDIYSNASGLGTTDAEKRVYYQYQQQAYLRGTFLKMDKVKDATVFIDLGEDSSFVLSKNEKPATASIMLTLEDGQTLSSQQVKAITELVSKSVSGLEPENIRIVDSHMVLYSAGGESEIETVDSHIALQRNVQEQFQRQIVNLLGPVFGEDNVLAEVGVMLNFDSRHTESVEYSTPAGSTEGIVVSMQEVVEKIINNADGSVAGVDANGNASQYLESADGGDAIYYNVSREVNYEINQTLTQIEAAQGQIERLSVSVILNSSNVDDYADEVKQLVSTAIGAKTDSITVQMLPFEAAAAKAERDAATVAAAQKVEEQIASNAQSAQTLRLAIVVAGALIAVIMLFAIIRMLLPRKEAMGLEGIDVMVGDDTSASHAGAASAIDNLEIDFDNKDNNLAVLEEYIGRNPESAANLLRNWLNEE